MVEVDGPWLTSCREINEPNYVSILLCISIHPLSLTPTHPHTHTHTHIHIHAHTLPQCKSEVTRL